jgi:GT2 family glycosyltransferase
MGSGQDKSVLILGVIYNSWKDTVRFVDSITCCFDREANLILVDNSEISPDPSFMDRIKEYDFITYIKSGKNLGYFQGARYGLNYYLKDNPVIPKWIIVCNVDIIFDTRLLMNKLRPCENIPDLGVIAPAIISDKWKTDYNPFRMERIPLKKLTFYRVIYSSILIHNGYILLHYLKKFSIKTWHKISANRRNPSSQSENIYAPHGSCIIFNKNYFEKGGTLDHPTFLFGEEIFVGETAGRLGLKLLYLPEIKVLHYEHSSIGNFISRRINKYYKQSIEDMINNFYQ